MQDDDDKLQVSFHMKTSGHYFSSRLCRLSSGVNWTLGKKLDLSRPLFIIYNITGIQLLIVSVLFRFIWYSSCNIKQNNETLVLPMQLYMMTCAL